MYHPRDCDSDLTVDWIVEVPLRIGLWDPFQMSMKMAYKCGVILTTYKSWDDPTTSWWLKPFCLVKNNELARYCRVIWSKGVRNHH